MNGLLRVAENLLIDCLLSNDAPLTGKTKAGLSLMTLSGFLLLIGSGFLLFGFHLYLTTHYSADIAAIVTGASIIIMAMCIALISYAILRYKRWKIQQFKLEILDSLQDVFKILDDEVGDVVRDNPKTSIATAGVTGFAVGENFL